MPGQNTLREANADNIQLFNLVGAGAGTVNGEDQVNPYASGLTLVIDITNITGGTPAFTVTIEGKDPVSGKYYTILATTALAVTGTTVLKVYPGLVVAANSAANAPLPKTWRVKYAFTGTTPTVTAKIGASLHI